MSSDEFKKETDERMLKLARQMMETHEVSQKDTVEILAWSILSQISISNQMWSHDDLDRAVTRIMYGRLFKWVTIACSVLIVLLVVLVLIAIGIDVPGIIEIFRRG